MCFNNSIVCLFGNSSNSINFYLGSYDVPSTPGKLDQNEDSTGGDKNANDIKTDLKKMESSKRIFKIKRKK